MNYTDLEQPMSRVNRATRMVLCYLHTGFEWNEENFLASRCGNELPCLEDFECQLLSMNVPITWRSIRRVFPKIDDPVNRRPI